jgi:hypothetical protein
MILSLVFKDFFLTSLSKCVYAAKGLKYFNCMGFIASKENGKIVMKTVRACRGLFEFTIASSATETEESHEENISQENQPTTFRTKIQNV